MKATEAKILDFLKKSPQFVIPIYQRTYSWTERECQQLWDDILRTGRNDAISAHFVGSIVYIEKGLYQVTSQSPLLVIDGQQRLTTIMLVLEALARRLGETEPVEGFSAKKLRNYYLLNPLEEGEQGFKLLLTQTDKESLLALVQQKPMPAEYSLRIAENFALFEKKVKDLNDEEVAALCKGLAKLVLVDISLNRDQDNPQLIFESMNSTGRELSQADLIRNFILMGLETDHQTRLYKDHWRPMEVSFGQEAYGSQFDSFMRHYLTFKTGDIPNVNAVYEAFKAHAREPDVAASGVDALVADIHDFANYYCAMALGHEKDKDLGAAFHDLRELRVDVAYPFLLELYHDYRMGILSKNDFIQAVRLVEAYVFRRAVCSIPTNSLNKTFAVFGRELRKSHYLESIQAYLLNLPSYRRFPRNDEFRREIVQRDLYNFRSRSYWLRRLENYDRKERVHVDEYTIEHILPQNENLSPRWPEDLGPEWQRIQETYLHTLGNLTLTGYNSEYSDRPFAEKRDMEGGFRHSPIKLNTGLGSLDAWNEAAIQERAKRLAEQATEVWAAPSLPADVLEKYQPKNRKTGVYTIEDHPKLGPGAPMRSLFDAFRREVLALDPCITEEFRKLYVAYKAETNFVDLVPLNKALRITLNLRFHELDDPRGMGRDVTGRGRWCNGDIEVDFNTHEDLPYIMGLVRQSFEKQMGSEELLDEINGGGQS
ncbi:hypothetical protein AZH53_09905 [Methanomicrobiaceae archaeon CYW5]|uniref:DUF262 and DUF1524 domain-containing protein n=1 Tax=Methanovulcanius yangii TaxID=1789227 RepID=UPI0029C9E306|nr:DUF262 and DUF1524 domain-containing protein [Methanovulcanius yangii]MBT8508718.1 hypothetical protein [Methanovulcanius yangii]